MPLHFIHISKTGGSAIKQAIRSADVSETPFGRLHLHPHPYKLEEVPEDHPVFFCVRDPVSRFMSSFYSRKRKGRPKYFRDWNEVERAAFEIFETPQALGTALASSDPQVRGRAETALNGMRQVKRGLRRWLNSPTFLRRRRDQIVYIARQETLTDEWDQMKEVLGLPTALQLPSGREEAHRGDEDEDRRLDPIARKALTKWYGHDYLVISYCDKLRVERGWGKPVGESPPVSILVSAQAKRILGSIKRNLERVTGT